MKRRIEKEEEEAEMLIQHKQKCSCHVSFEVFCMLHACQDNHEYIKSLLVLQNFSTARKSGNIS